MKLYVLFTLPKLSDICEATEVVDQLTMDENPVWIYDKKAKLDASGDYVKTEIVEVNLSEKDWNKIVAKFMKHVEVKGELNENL